MAGYGISPADIALVMKLDADLLRDLYPEELASGHIKANARVADKEWGEQRGVWKDRPRQDEASHAADGFITFACSDFPEKERLAAGKEGDCYRRPPERRSGVTWVAA